jgi:hypothetical protein
MNDPKPIPDVVAAALAEKGIAADSLVRTLLIQDGHFVGEKYRFDGGYVIWVADSNAVEIHVEDGTDLKTVETKTAA